MQEFLFLFGGGVDLCIYRVHAITKYSGIFLGFHTKAMM